MTKRILMGTAIMIALIMISSSLGSVYSKEEQEMTLVIRMMDEQHRWFRENIVIPFEEEYNCKINVATFDKLTDIEIMLSAEAKSNKHETGLVKVMTEALTPLKDYMMPLEDAGGKERLTEDLQEYVDKAVEIGTFDNKPYYMPRKLEIRTLLFLKSKVNDAVNGWTKFKDEIDSALKIENGYGLPANYALERDPNQWDMFDLFVVSYYWAHTTYFRRQMPRMAHRAKDYGGTTTFMVDRTYQMGGTMNDILEMNTDPVVDMFEWEALFKKNELYNPNMWKEKWSGGGIWKAMQNGAVFLCYMHQIDAFFIHGGSTPTMPGFIKNPKDMGLVLMPMGVSLELDANGNPVREGSRRASLSGWWWGVPKTSPNPELSYELARWITNYENHLAECQTFGMMPIRKDVLGKLEAFPYPWMSEIFEIGYNQLSIPGTETAPLIPEWSLISANYRNAWYHIILKENYQEEGKTEISRAYIIEMLEPFWEKNREILHS